MHGLAVPLLYIVYMKKERPLFLVKMLYHGVPLYPLCSLKRCGRYSLDFAKRCKADWSGILNQRLYKVFCSCKRFVLRISSRFISHFTPEFTYLRFYPEPPHMVKHGAVFVTLYVDIPKLFYVFAAHRIRVKVNGFAVWQDDGIVHKNLKKA